MNIFLHALAIFYPGGTKFPHFMSKLPYFVVLQETEFYIEVSKFLQDVQVLHTLCIFSDAVTNFRLILTNFCVYCHYMYIYSDYISNNG